MDQDTIDQVRQTGKETNNPEYVFEIFQEGTKTLRAEIEPLLNKLKIVNIEFAIDILEEELVFLSDILALATKHLTAKSRMPISPEQALIIARLNGIIKEVPKSETIENVSASVTQVEELI